MFSKLLLQLVTLDLQRRELVLQLVHVVQKTRVVIGQLFKVTSRLERLLLEAFQHFVVLLLVNLVSMSDSKATQAADQSHKSCQVTY